MYSLLSQKIQHLENERVEMFKLLDSFSDTINQYKLDNKQMYKDYIDEKNKIEKEKDAKLRDLEKSHSEIIKLLNDTLTSIDRNFSVEKRKLEDDAFNKVSEINAAMTKKEADEKLYLDDKKKTFRGDLDKKKIYMVAIQAEYERLVKHLGQKYIDSIVESLGYVDQNYLTENRDELLNEKIVKHISSVSSSIRSMSVTKAKLFHQKKIESIVGESILANGSLTLYESIVNNTLDKEKADSDKRVQDYNKKCNNDKNDILTKRDNEINALSIKKNQDIAETNDSIAKEMNSYNNNLNLINTQFVEDIKNLEENYKKQTENFNLKFDNKISQEYPADKFNAWMNLFSNYPKSIMDYSKPDTTQMNYRIGTARINVSDWFINASDINKDGNYLKTIIKRYKNLEDNGYLTVPYSLSIDEGTSMIISFSQKQNERTKEIISSIAARYMFSVRSNNLNFLLNDPDGGDTFGQLVTLDPSNANDPSRNHLKSIMIGTPKIHIDYDDIESNINDIVSSENMIRMKSEAETIRKFNELNEHSQQVYRCIINCDYPIGLKSQTINRLRELISSYRRCGISFFALQPDLATEFKNDVLKECENLSNEVVMCRMDDNSQAMKIMNTKSSMEKKANVYVYKLLNDCTLTDISNKYLSSVEETATRTLRFDETEGVYPKLNEMYSGSSLDEVVVPIGYLEEGKPFNLMFSHITRVHAAINGSTGKGKTNLIHVFLTNLMLRYPPEEVKVYLIDFKHGLDYRIYAENPLPHFAAINISDEPELALNILKNITKEAQNRSYVFKDMEFGRYNKTNGDNKYPRIFVIVDELYELVKQADENISKEIIKYLDLIAHEYRAFGIHLIVAGQDLEKVEGFMDINSQCETRISMYDSNDEKIDTILGKGASSRMRSISAHDVGKAVFTVDLGKSFGVEQTALIKTEDGLLSKELQKLREYYKSRDYSTSVKISLTKVEENSQHEFSRFVRQGELLDLNGEMKIGAVSDITKNLNFIPRKNVWMLGGAMEKSKEAGTSVMFYALLSKLIEKFYGKNIDIWCTNCLDSFFMMEDEKDADFFGVLASRFENLTEYYTIDSFAESLDRLMEELEDRKDGKTGNDIWWFVAQPELYEPLDFNIINDLQILLKEGLNYGIHTMVWTSNLQSTKQLNFTKNLFNDLIILESEGEELKALLGYDIKNNPPKDYKAYLRKSNGANIFRIYDFPSAMWLNELYMRIFSMGYSFKD